MQNVPADLTAAQAMTDQPCKFTSEGLSTSGVSMADLHRGFTPESLPEDCRCDADGTNRVGDPYARPGFTGAPSKYQRL